MSDTAHVDYSAEVQNIMASAQRLGIELDEAETMQWLSAISASEAGVDVTVDQDSGVFGHRVTMLDFSPRDLARFRRIGKIVEVTGPEGIAESALALSGSAAQSKIQSFPGDCDFFQRLNIKAATRADACHLMAQLMRDKVLSTERGDSYQFLEAKLGSFPYDCTRGGKTKKKGSPISWSIEEIKAGETIVEKVDGTQVALKWEDVALDPGWFKLDWVVVDPDRKGLSNASNVIDVTWEAPDGTIVSLDGYLDAYFQEVYLDADALPVFNKVAKQVSSDALDEYIERLQGEVHKYLTDHLNYGKAAKRMYNIFRLTGRHGDAAFVRELFDEPTTILYQVWSLITTLENATQPDSAIPIESVRAQADALVVDVVDALEGDAETEIVKALLNLRHALENQENATARSAELEGAKDQVINLVNTFFHDRLVGVPTIKAYIDEIQGAGASASK